jgi:hypothetical protein
MFSIIGMQLTCLQVICSSCKALVEHAEELKHQFINIQEMLQSMHFKTLSILGSCNEHSQTGINEEHLSLEVISIQDNRKLTINDNENETRLNEIDPLFGSKDLTMRDQQNNLESPFLPLPLASNIIANTKTDKKRKRFLADANTSRIKVRCYSHTLFFTY